MLFELLNKMNLVSFFRNLGTDCAVVAWHDSGLFNSIGVELNEDDGDLIQELGAKKKLYSQKGCVIGLVRRCDLERTDGVRCNFITWRSKTNRRIVESSFAAETHGGIMGYGQAHYLRVLLSEVFYGEDLLKSDESTWGSLISLVMCTDCRSVYDHVKKDGQSIGDKDNALHVAVLRQVCSGDKSPSGTKARLLWVPTRHQCADGMTKSGLRHSVQRLFREGLVIFHAKSAKAIQSRKSRVSVET